MKLLFSLATPIAVGVFTLVTTIQNQNLARLDRDKDKEQTEDQQRETVFINYINDVAKFHNEKDLTEKNILYLRTKTLAALRKLDPERKKQVLLFLRDSELLRKENFYLDGSDFSEVELNGNHGSQCRFDYTSFFQMTFRQAIFLNCHFQGVIFKESNFREAQLINCSFTDCEFDQMHFEKFTLKNSYLRNSFWFGSFLMDGDLTGTSFIETNFVNVNLFGAHFTDQQLISINNSILPNGSFSSIDESNLIGDCRRESNVFLPNPFIQDPSSDICAFISTKTEQVIEIYFYNHSLLIEHGQASFLLSFEVNNGTRPVNATLILWDTEGYIEEIHSTMIMPQTPIYRFQGAIPRASRTASIWFIFNETNIWIDNLTFRIRLK